jgi:hypothetical protein
MAMEYKLPCWFFKKYKVIRKDSIPQCDGKGSIFNDTSNQHQSIAKEGPPKSEQNFLSDICCESDAEAAPRKVLMIYR